MAVMKKQFTRPRNSKEKKNRSLRMYLDYLNPYGEKKFEHKLITL